MFKVKGLMKFEAYLGNKNIRKLLIRTVSNTLHGFYDNVIGSFLETINNVGLITFL